MSNDSALTGPFVQPQRSGLRDDFEQAWPGPPRPRIENYLCALVEPERSELLRELLALELELRRDSGEEASLAEYESRFPDHGDLVRAALGDAGCLTLERIGRYQVRRLLGGGGFGHVYLGYDDKADREVAIKVPRRDCLTSAQAARAMLHEARSVAKLNHAGIVPLYDVGEHADHWFLVYQFIDGMSLAQRLRQGRLAPDQGACLIAQIAETLHHAHGVNLFHRDIKPANILLDKLGQPYLTDFGLAVREDELAGEQGRRTGTYPYMAPEQVRGEGNRIDGRTDVYGLGVVLYESLCGRRPFRGTRPEVFDQILHHDPRPPRQIEHAIGPELERICLKAMAKRMSSRYATAGDLAADLKEVAAPQALPLTAFSTPRPHALTRDFTPTPITTPLKPPPAAVVPRGLCSFRHQDSEFFLELLPGPRDRGGLPDAIRFWKTAIESRDADSTFAVGLMFGPTGCGKSSLLKAGILPRLLSSVLPVYVEATGDQTEMRLTRALEKACPDLDAGSSPQAMMAALRRGAALRNHSKLLVVIDQFEQWLHVHGQDMEETDLVAALRQANGTDVQVILMVRDDFWMSISRLFDCLEINLDRARNTRAIDLFHVDHATHVLRLFGQAYGRVALDPEPVTPDQAKFLNGAVAQLSQDGHVVPVRLSLFADLMKDRPWTPAGLVADGGELGVGIRFLEENFRSRTALPDLRVLEKPARKLLEALLPKRGTDIKGEMRSRQELAQACELAEESPRFARLLKILDLELHIITPTEREQAERQESDPEPVSPTESIESGSSLGLAPCYQLTHDYLVPALRQWLTSKEKERWRGRAALSLAERAAQWGPQREVRFLPSLPVYLYLSLGVPRKKRQPLEKSLLGAASRYHALVWGSVLVALLMVGYGTRRHLMQMRAESAVDSLVIAPPAALPSALEKLASISGRCRFAAETACRHGPGGMRRERADSRIPAGRGCDCAGQRSQEPDRSPRERTPRNGPEPALGAH
jgi:serine/threonine protein kinase